MPASSDGPSDAGEATPAFDPSGMVHAVDAQRLRDALLEIETVGLIFWGPDMTIVDVNDAFLAMTGFGHEEVLGLGWRDLTPPEFHAASEVAVFQLESVGEIEPYEKQYYRKDGSRWWGLFAAHGLGEDLALELVIEITDRKNAERALRTARDAAEEASRTKSAFMATMSHELRTPLNAILGYTDLLLAGVPEAVPPEATDHVRRIAFATEHLRELIEEILTFSRLQAGRESLAVEDVSIAQLLDEIHAVIDPMAAESGLRLVLESDRGPERIRTDPGKLRQILTSLLGNAIKFTKEGTVLLAIRGSDDGVSFRVRDTGRGIEPGHLTHVFEPFWQGRGVRSGSSAGTGLGLAISNRFADILGGEITVESEPGDGSVFTLLLPPSVLVEGA